MDMNGNGAMVDAPAKKPKAPPRGVGRTSPAPHGPGPVRPAARVHTRRTGGHPILNLVRRSAHRARLADKAAEKAVELRDQLILDAVQAGHSQAEVARAAKLSRQRVQAIINHAKGGEKVPRYTPDGFRHPQDDPCPYCQGQGWVNEDEEVTA